MGQGRIAHGDVHETPLAAAPGIEEGRQDTHHGTHGAAQQIADLQVGNGRLATIHADLVEDAGVADVVEVMARRQGQGTALAVAGDGAEHQAGIEAAQGLVAHAQLVHDAGAEALDDHIGLRRQAPEQGRPFRIFQVQAQAPLVAVHRPVENADALGAVAHGAGVIAGAVVFDLDHVGPQVGQMQGGHRAGQEAGQVEDADTLQGLAGHVCSLGLKTIKRGGADRTPPRRFPVGSGWVCIYS